MFTLIGYWRYVDSSLNPIHRLIFNIGRLVPIMLLKFPIMSPKFCLLCSIYAPYVNHHALQIQQFISLILLKLQITNISGYSSSSTVQHTINNASMYILTL